LSFPAFFHILCSGSKSTVILAFADTRKRLDLVSILFTFLPDCAMPPTIFDLDNTLIGLDLNDFWHFQACDALKQTSGFGDATSPIRHIPLTKLT
jgi:hypothetical protein